MNVREDKMNNSLGLQIGKNVFKLLRSCIISSK